MPNWIGLDRAHAERARLAPADRVPLIPPEQVVKAALELLRSGAGGTVVEI
ncbi:hypothetical protein [Paractinoplanes maris]|uniref:hypothetical protein n=1 Tax=Paractinoplanes maris TaxID=1734446 RepID=UPI00202038D9|nr:hypothetical protein [Actinoplanes maris]